MAKKTKTTKTSTLLWALVLVLSLGVGIFAGANFVKEQGEYNQSEEEYTALRQFAPGASMPMEQEPAPKTPEKNLAEINPDYIGWLRVEGTGIDYPLVQSQNNDTYLYTSFEGQQNPLGAIFMDSRCQNGFDSSYLILYGHNAKNHTMFGDLAKYLNEDFLEQNPQIIITLPSGDTKAYRIYAARRTTTADTAYQWASYQADPAAFLQALGAPEGSEQVLVLSTCGDPANKDERVLVLAVPA